MFNLKIKRINKKSLKFLEIQYKSILLLDFQFNLFTKLKIYVTL